MPSPLNRQPSGLLEFFGIKNGEWGPRELGQVLTPTLDLWRHYVSAFGSDDVDGTVTVNGSTATGGTDVPLTAWTMPNNTYPVVVPAGEVWYLDNMSINVVLTPGAGSNISAVGLAGTYPNVGQLHLVPFTQPGERLVSDAGVATGIVQHQMYPYWLKPAQTLSLYWAGTIAATETGSFRITGRITRLKI